ncbi:MAG: GNAT family N-acetyltransferase [Pseudomonadota bacterium]
MTTIRTARLRLVPVRLPHLEAFAAGGDAGLAALLGVSVAPDWAGADALQAIAASQAFLVSNPDSADWWMHVFVHEADNRLIGLGGYKGAPSGGRLEFGYEFAPGYRGQGLATEAAEGMIAHAFLQPDVDHVIAHTLPQENASTRVLKRCGLAFDEVVQDPEDGEIWRWRRDRG